MCAFWVVIVVAAIASFTGSGMEVSKEGILRFCLPGCCYFVSGIVVEAAFVFAVAAALVFGLRFLLLLLLLWISAAVFVAAALVAATVFVVVAAALVAATLLMLLLLFK